MAEAKFLNGSLMRHVVVMAFTGSIGLSAIFVSDLVDLLFISMLGEAELAAAVGYSGAIMFFTVSICIGLTIAMTALVSRTLGAGDLERAKQLATSTLTFSFIVASVVAVIVWFAVPILLSIVGAQGRTHELAVTFLRIIVPSLPIMAMGMGATGILRAHGDARRAMWATIAGGVVNAGLDPIFIFVLDFGLNGAAMASVCARIGVLVVAIIPIYRHHGGLERFSFKRMREDSRAISAIAVPAMLTNVATPIGNAYVTATLAPFGDNAVAAMAVIGRLTPVAFAVVFALSGAIGPIVGQNFGAKAFDRVRSAFLEGLRFTALYVLAVSALLFFLREPISTLFGLDGEARELLYLFCGPLALGFIFNGALFASNAAFNNLNRPTYSTALNWGRNTLGTIPLAMAGSALAGAPGVLIGQALGGVIFGIAGSWLSLRLIAAYRDGRIDPDKPRPPFRWPFPLNPHTTIRG